MRHALSLIALSAIIVACLTGCSGFPKQYSNYDRFLLTKDKYSLPGKNTYSAYRKYEKLCISNKQALRLPNVFVTDKDLEDFQFAVLQYKRQAKANTTSTNNLASKDIDYSPYFQDDKRRARGKEYSDFLSGIVKDYCKKTGIKTNNQEPLPDKALSSIREDLALRCGKLMTYFWDNLYYPNNIDSNYISQTFLPIFSSRIIQAMNSAKQIYPNGNNGLGKWTVFYPGQRLEENKRHCGFEEQLSSPHWYKIYSADKDVAPVYMRIEFFGKDLIPVIVGLKNATYDIDISPEL